MELLQRTAERVLLDEALLNGRTINMKAKPFLLEVSEKGSHLQRLMDNPDIPLFLTGIIQSGDVPNRNGRIYQWEYLKRECIRYMENEIRQGLSYCELDHPETSLTPMLNNAAAAIDDLWFKDKNVIARIKVLNAFMPQSAPGLKVRGFLLNGKSVGISSRALGSIEEYSNSEWDIVADDLEMICWDIVSNASNYGSEKLTLTEKTTGRFVNPKYKPYLTESQIKIYNKGASIKESVLKNLSAEQKTYLNILGVEKFLQIYNSQL